MINYDDSIDHDDGDGNNFPTARSYYTKEKPKPKRVLTQEELIVERNNNLNNAGFYDDYI